MDIIYSANKSAVKGLTQVDNITYDVTFTVNNYAEVTENNVLAFDTIIDGVVTAGDMQSGKINILTNPFADKINYGVLAGNVATMVDIETGDITNPDPVENNYSNPGYELEIITSKTANFRVKGQLEKNGLLHSSTYVGPVAGTLLEHVETELLAMIDGQTSGDSAVSTMYTVNNPDVNSPDVVFNDSNISAAYKDAWSGASILLSTESDIRYPMHLVSSRHAVIAYHIFRDSALAVGSEVVFKRINGEYQKVTISAFTTLDLKDSTDQNGASGEYLGADLAVVLLDQDVTGCQQFQVFEEDWLHVYSPMHVGSERYKYAANGALAYLRRAMHNLNAAWVDGGWIQIHALSDVDYGADYAFAEQDVPGKQAAFNPWGIASKGGDSSGTYCMPVNNRLVLLGCNSGTSVPAHLLSYYIAEINTIMNDLSEVPQGTYAVEHPDLSEFLTFN